MKNVTITMPEELFRRARVEAAKDGKSLSRWVADIVKRDIEGMGQAEAMRRFLSGPDYPGVAADRPTREELYAERLFHRHERTALREGPDPSGKARKSSKVARGTRR
jgi:hypothetical protein